MNGSYVGIDLAAQPRRTGVAVLRETGEGVLLEHVGVGADDDALLDHLQGAAKIGVDVPLGCPKPFVDLLTAHAAGTMTAPASTGGDWRRGLALRATDLEVHRRTGLTPLSVATDRIAHPALRWAGIEARLREEGIDVARDGAGRICEVYPAATLRRWGLPHRGYKGTGGRAARRGLVEALGGRFPGLDWAGHDAACVEEDDVLDAVIATLMAREVARGRAVPPPDPLREIALVEGWIWLPA